MVSLIQTAFALSLAVVLTSGGLEDVGEGGVPNSPPQNGAAAPRERLEQHANLQGLGNVAIWTGAEASQAVNYFYSYVVSCYKQHQK